MSFSARGSSNSSRTGSRGRNVQRSAFPFGSVSQTGSDIVAAQLGELRQKLILGRAAGQVLEYVTDRDPRTSNARLAEPDSRVNRDPIKALHWTKRTPVGLRGQSRRILPAPSENALYLSARSSAPSARSSASVAGAASMLPRPRMTTASGVCPR